MRVYVFASLIGCCWLADGTYSVHGGADCATKTAAGRPTTTTTTTTTTAHQLNQFKEELYATISENIRQNSRKLKLEDFSWAIFSGTNGRLLGLRDYKLASDANAVVAAAATAAADTRSMNTSLEFTVPLLQASWDKSVCMGYACAMAIELRDCVFYVRILLDARDCAIEHLAYLKRYGDARCHATYEKTSPISIGLVESTVRLLSHVLNTKPFEKIIKDNVNYALLHLPLFNATDIRRLCDAYRTIYPQHTA